MRVLFTSQPGFGHWHPLVPVAQALEEAGHEVAFATLPKFSSTIAAGGFRAFPAGADETAEELKERKAKQVSLEQFEQARFMWTDVFAGTRAESSMPDLMAIAQEWQPDLIVRDMIEFGGYIVAESLQLPHAAFHVAAFRPQLHMAIRPQISHLRASAGLPPDPNLDTLYRYLLLSPFPPSFQDPAAPFPPTTHAIRHIGFNSSTGEQLPDWVRDLPEQPTVYVTLGTVFNKMKNIWQAVLEGLAGEPINLILTIGHDGDPAEFGPQPANVHIERYIPQSLLLPYCNLVITHGGSGTTKDALTHGLPMVIIPVAADQYANAARSAALGVARVVPSDMRTPEAIRAAAREVLGNSLYRQNAERLRDEIAALPGMEYAVSLLEQLALERRPMLAARDE
ncbi:MAG: glycosyltransferase [Chloroflexota bacterium]